jgi:hypothetical protein
LLPAIFIGIWFGERVKSIANEEQSDKNASR